MRGGRDAILLQALLRVREKAFVGCSFNYRAIVQRLICERMKLASNGVDVREWKLTRVRAIRQQDKNALTFGVDPAARAGETSMAERIGRETCAGGRIFRGGELPRKRTRLVQAFGQSSGETVYRSPLSAIADNSPMNWFAMPQRFARV